MTEDIQLVEAIHERDVDLILLEELNTNNHFASWFVRQLELPELTKFMGAWRSMSGFGLGETDLLLSYYSGEKIVYLLIENKLDADFQDKQFERYKSRGEQYVLENKCVECFCVLFAPRQYAEDQDDFEKYITYEDLRSYFEFDANRRSIFKAGLLNIAIEKLKRGYRPVNSEPAQKFFLAYWKYRGEYFPEFEMNKPNIIPANSDWIQMRKDDLKGIVFYHKLENGFIDATFINCHEEIEFRIKEILPVNYTIVKHKSGRFSLRQKVASIDKMKDFEGQTDIINVGLTKARDVSDWIKANAKLTE